MGAKIAMLSASSAFSPPTAWRRAGAPAGSSLAKMLRPVASLTLTCRCRPLPALAANGLAMKVASQPWRSGDALGDALVHHRLVGGAQGVGPVPQGQLQLAGGVFGDRPFQRHALGVGRRPQLAQEAGR